MYLRRNTNEEKDGNYSHWGKVKNDARSFLWPREEGWWMTLPMNKKIDVFYLYTGLFFWFQEKRFRLDKKNLKKIINNNSPVHRTGFVGSSFLWTSQEQDKCHLRCGRALQPSGKDTVYETVQSPFLLGNIIFLWFLSNTQAIRASEMLPKTGQNLGNHPCSPTSTQ